jgi:ATP:cob(I)alamin adenosyltransferase
MLRALARRAPSMSAAAPAALLASSAGGAAAAPPAAAAAAAAAATRYKVYTKTGDAGTSSLYNGERRGKDDDFFSALGDVDELNASVGLAREHCAGSSAALEAQLVEIQCRLLDVGSAIATPILTSSPAQLARAAFPSEVTASLEAWIDAMDEELPPLKNFILPVRAPARARSATGVAPILSFPLPPPTHTLALRPRPRAPPRSLGALPLRSCTWRAPLRAGQSARPLL